MASGSGRGYDIKVGDRVVANDAGLICTDQFQTALRSTRPYARMLGGTRSSASGSPLSSYSVRVSELGIVVTKGDRVVFSRRNP